MDQKNRRQRLHAIEAGKNIPGQHIQGAEVRGSSMPQSGVRPSAKEVDGKGWAVPFGLGLLAALITCLLLSRPLGCVINGLSSDAIALIGFLFLGIAAGVNSLPGKETARRIKLTAGGLALGLFLFTVMVLFRPPDKQSCAAAGFPPLVTVTPTVTQSSTPSLAPTLTATITPLPTSTQPEPTPTVNFTPTPTLTPTPAEPTATPTTTFTPTITSTPTPVTFDGAVLQYVPAGPFQMGSNSADDPRAQPEHTVFVNAFWIDRMEVTNGMYARCVAAGKCAAPLYPYTSYYQNYYGNPTFDNYPVVFVNWYKARDYCEWTGRRLPTEAEWEKAARNSPPSGYQADAMSSLNLESWNALNIETAPLQLETPVLAILETPTAVPTVGIPAGPPYPSGETLDCSNANTKGCDKDTLPVDRFPAGTSPYGVLNMAGNVAEWTSSQFMPYPYDPSDGRENLLLNGDTVLRVVRGGSWLSAAPEAKTYYRSAIYGNILAAAPDQPFAANQSNSTVGFRCAQDAP